jgi:hypothetical protein
MRATDGQILSSQNLRCYISGQYRRRLPDWPLPDILSSKVPVLAYRNYLNEYKPEEWPTCWEDDRPSRISPALEMAVRILARIVRILGAAPMRSLDLDKTR